jgi:hypothetical protein
MHADDSTLVVVQREWDGWRTAQVRLADLEDVHWFQPTRAPRPLIHAFVLCSSVVSGEVPHDCRQTPAPHRLLVCVLKTHTAPGIYAQLSALANARVLNGGATPNSRIKPPGHMLTSQLTAPRGNA